MILFSLIFPVFAMQDNINPLLNSAQKNQISSSKKDIVTQNTNTRSRRIKHKNTRSRRIKHKNTRSRRAKTVNTLSREEIQLNNLRSKLIEKLRIFNSQFTRLGEIGKSLQQHEGYDAKSNKKLDKILNDSSDQLKDIIKKAQEGLSSKRNNKFLSKKKRSRSRNSR